MKTPTLLSYASSSAWDDVKKAVEKVYDGPDAVIAKPTRFGFTTTILKIADARGDKILLVQPTNKINETAKKAVPDMLPIYGHKYCRLLVEQEDPLLLDLGILPLPSVCPRGPSGCKEYPDCDLTKAWFETACVRTISYQKLVTLMFGYNPKESESALLQEQLKDIDIVICDESHLISSESPPSVDICYKSLKIPPEFVILSRIYNNFKDLIFKLHENDTIEQIKALSLANDSHLAIPHQINSTVQSTMLTYAFMEIRRLAKQRTTYSISDDDIKFLSGMISVMSCREQTTCLTKTGSGDKWTIKGKPTYESPTWENAIRRFLRLVCPKSKVFFASGTQYERSQGFYEGIVGRSLEHVCLPDVKHTNSMMTIIPDKWTYSAVADQKGGTQTKRIVENILDILADHPCDPIYAINFNTKLQERIAKKLAKYRLPRDFFMQDYYRSSNSIGVECEARIGIAIGIANTPTNTFDCVTNNVPESQALRLQDVHSATWQAWSRIKDPEGKVPSKLYCIGVRSDAVDAVITQGSNRQVFYNGKGANGRHIPPKITINEELPRPKVLMEAKSNWSSSPCNAEAACYLAGHVPVSELPKFLDSVKTFDNYLYSNIGKNQRFLPVLDSSSPLRMYNLGCTVEQQQESALALKILMVSREDKCGFQWHYPNSLGKYGYRVKTLSVPFDDVLQQHLAGAETIALPPFTPEDICYFLLSDFDDHDGTTPQTSNVQKYTAFLRSKNIQYIVLLSGTHTGHHVIIPIYPTKTYTAWKFHRQLIHDAGLKGIKEIETYPKQKSFGTTKDGYGNQTKLPCGFNWKAGKKTQFLDPVTLEPVPYVEISRVNRIRELPDPIAPRKQKVVMNKNSASHDVTLPDVRIHGELRQCVMNALQYKLIGHEGNDMRIAVACEAISSGMDREDIIALFEGQEDFNRSKTEYYVDYYIRNNYRAWKCETIREKCSKFVDCSNCLYTTSKKPKHYISEGATI
ncbi:MAG: hypothetical protein QG591_2571 [Planctomycetota bacterium]|nr:hypothetical protein [Planctomycetota bacterium]